VTPKRALIVDDSKSARVVLSRLLEKHDLSVDLCDSAEAALHFLRENRPDVIFMDHLMSGIDGLSAVRAIKSDPRIASIPIMMYTSQDHDVYADEARAVGAAGVLPKQMSASDITQVLAQLQVLPGREATPAGPASAAPPPAEAAGLPAAPAAPVVPPLSGAEVRALVEPLLQEQGIELRRFVVASLDGVSARLVTEVDERLRRAVGELSATIAKATEPPPLAPPPRPTGWIALAVVASLAAAGFGAFAWQARLDLAASRVAAAPAALPASVAEPAAAAPAVAAPVASAPPARASTLPGPRLPVPYGETPLAPARMTALANWLADLERRGFAGVARVSISAGEFCLTGNPAEGYAPAPGELPANRCDVVGNPADDAQRVTGKDSPPLASLTDAVRDRSHGAIEVRLVYATRAGTAGYPPAADASAAQWNAVAQTRNFVQFVAEPRAVAP